MLGFYIRRMPLKNHSNAKKTACNRNCQEKRKFSNDFSETRDVTDRWIRYFVLPSCQILTNFQAKQKNENLQPYFNCLYELVYCGNGHVYYDKHYTQPLNETNYLKGFTCCVTDGCNNSKLPKPTEKPKPNNSVSQGTYSVLMFFFGAIVNCFVFQTCM